jgi:hypothetical protein
VRSASNPDIRTLASLVSRWLLLVVCMGGSLLSWTVVARSSGLAPNGLIPLDIPAQPLDQALDAFGAASGLQIFYESGLTAGRHSTALKGTFDPQVALRVLLQGSDLTARVIAVGTISVAKLRDADVAEAKRQAEANYLPYYGMLQAGVMKALCIRAETRPGNYHIALQYWIDVGGKVARVRLIGSSGANERDAAIIEALRGLILSPPGDVPQPVTMAIEPVQQGSCPGAMIEGARVR